jgi:hypothetical protein
MGIGTLLHYLIGDREAILQIAANRHALWIGLLFVLSAGFAREYDGEDLLHEPGYLLLPLAASLLSSLLLFSVAYGAALLKGQSVLAFPSRYLSFLGLFWLTAPLAWLYAIPYERFCTPVQAVSLNLLTLGLVSVWRVALMTRVLMVLLGYSVAAALCLVLLFADAVALTLLRFLPFPVLDVMGGLRLSPSQELVRGVAERVALVGGCSLPLWLIAAMILLLVSKPHWLVGASSIARPRIGLACLAVVSVVIWLPILPWTQPEQQRRRVVEKLYQQGEQTEALAFLSRHRREDFPPHWEPPYPRLRFYEDYTPEFLAFVTEVSGPEVAPWVRETYFELLRPFFRRKTTFNDEGELPLAGILGKTPEGRALLDEMAEVRESDRRYQRKTGRTPAR